MRTVCKLTNGLKKAVERRPATNDDEHQSALSELGCCKVTTDLWRLLAIQECNVQRFVSDGGGVVYMAYSALELTSALIILYRDKIRDNKRGTTRTASYTDAASDLFLPSNAKAFPAPLLFCCLRQLHISIGIHPTFLDVTTSLLQIPKNNQIYTV